MINISVILNPRQYEDEIALLADTYIDLLSSGSEVEDRDVIYLLIAIENLNYDNHHKIAYKMSVIKRLYLERAVVNSAAKQATEKEKRLSDVGRYMNGYMKESLY